ncbi:NUDIX domain-containing protein [Candidatus Daviesbacteria bacterium]|nr:NUDIX domain-containing protein [Candidatus Daviesbacteria bacterium]
MDQVIWVDEKDNILGIVSRKEAHQKSLLHRIIAIIILNDKGEILLQKRSKNKDTFPGMYTISASGHVDRGENYNQAAQREIQEELGVNAKLTFIKTVINDHPEHRQMQAFYLARHNGPFKIQNEEVDETRFFTTAEIKNMLPNVTPTVIIALELLKS